MNSKIVRSFVFIVALMLISERFVFADSFRWKYLGLTKNSAWAEISDYKPIFSEKRANLLEYCFSDSSVKLVTAGAYNLGRVLVIERTSSSSEVKNEISWDRSSHLVYSLLQNDEEFGDQNFEITIEFNDGKKPVTINRMVSKL